MAGKDYKKYLKTCGDYAYVCIHCGANYRTIKPMHPEDPSLCQKCYDMTLKLTGDAYEMWRAKCRAKRKQEASSRGIRTYTFGQLTQRNMTQTQFIEAVNAILQGRAFYRTSKRELTHAECMICGIKPD